MRANRRYFFVCLAVIISAVFLSARIALLTPADTHPDEINHLDAFCYFEHHWWYPPFGAAGIRYSPYGIARVYLPEIVYWLYGRIGSFVRPVAERIVAGPSTHTAEQDAGSKIYSTYLPIISSGDYCRSIVQIYRSLNVFLFLVTLSALFILGRYHKLAFTTGIVLSCVPQVIYTYSYANSDAWGLSLSLFLVFYALIEPHPFSSIKKTILLGLLTGLVLLSKENFWLTIVYAYLLIGFQLVKNLQENAFNNVRYHLPLRNIILLSGLVLAMIAPMHIIYPLSQHIPGKSGILQVARTSIDKTATGFNPDSPSASGFRLKSKGITIYKMLRKYNWTGLFLKSFYALFGYMTFYAPNYSYILALILAILNSSLTLLLAIRHWSSLHALIKFNFLLSPLIIIVNIIIVLINSWVVDFQPQGRYLFPSIFAIAFLAWGTIELENSWVRLFRVFSVIILFCLSCAILWLYVG